MMINATRKPNALKINDKLLKRLGVARPRVVLENALKHPSDHEIVVSELVKRDVAAGQGCLRQIVNINFLLRCELFKSRQFIAQHLYVGKFFVNIIHCFVC